MTTRALSPNASLRHLRHEAKSMLKAHLDGNPAICNTLRLIPRLASASDEEILRTPVHLQEVQHALAREYGCKSWTDLLKQVETMHTSLSAREQCLLKFMRDILEVSQACATTTYFWGKLTLDILEDRFLRVREHKSVDGLTLNMLDVLPHLMARYEARGYAVEFHDDIDMLQCRKDGVCATFNRLELDGETVMWHHTGREGTLYFPRHWLDETPTNFYGMPILTAGLKFDYLWKTNIRMFNPEYALQRKDYAAIAQLEQLMAVNKINPEEFLPQAWCYTPYWVKRGYPEYALPTVARPLQPISLVDAQ